MHQTYYEVCLACGKRYEAWELRRMLPLLMQCPDAKLWRKVIDDILPHAKTSDEANKIRDALNAMGITCTGWHRYYHEPNNDDYVLNIRIVEDSLEKLMCHVRFKGALVHGGEYVCGSCVAAMRKEVYNGGNEIPEIKCPRCDAVLISVKEE